MLPIGFFPYFCSRFVVSLCGLNRESGVNPGQFKALSFGKAARKDLSQKTCLKSRNKASGNWSWDSVYNKVCPNHRFKSSATQSTHSSMLSVSVVAYGKGMMMSGAMPGVPEKSWS